MARFRTLLRAATVAGPVVFKLVTTYGPELKRLREKNPDAFDRIASTVTGLGRGQARPSGVKGAHKRITDIREQVTYLQNSADDEYERDRAKLWAAQLDRLASALNVVGPMGAETREKELARVNERLDRLATDVLAAYIDEQDEDAAKGERP